jgi:TrkA-N domain
VTISVYVFSVVTAFLVEGEITNFFGRRKMEKRIRELNNHYIVFGLGDTGRYVVDELQKTSSPFVVVEHSEDAIKRFQEHYPANYKDTLCVLADATDEDALMAAGVDRARGVITALGALRGHIKSGQRWSLQNRPTKVAWDEVVLLRCLLRRQVCFGAPTPWTAFEYMAVMEEAIEHSGNGGAVAEQFAPVVHRSVRSQQSLARS